MTTRSKTGFPAFIVCKSFTLAASILGLAMAAMPSWAATPAMTLAASTGETIAFDSTGIATPGGTCPASTCQSTVIVGNGTNGFGVGVIAWIGTIGTFSGNLSGQTKPALAPPAIDINITSIKNSGASATLTISWTDVGFTAGESPSTMNITTNEAAGATYTSYFDNTNTPFLTGSPVAIATVGTAGGTVVTNVGPTSSPFSLTNVATLTIPSGGTATGDYSLTMAPAVALSCTSLATGKVGTPYTANLSATGGVTPYTFQITGGSISPLGLDMSTGVISGIPNTAGPLNFTAQVTDSSGLAGLNTASASCTINIVPNAPPPSISRDDTATIGFWHNKNGQALILALNGGASSKLLANWLATNFPYLYGVHSSNNLTNQTNTQVAALFLTFFGAGGQKTSAQILAGALASYVTSSTLAGTTATKYGFNSSAGGTGAKTYNTGSDGSAIGLKNNTSYTVLQLLQQANADQANGTFNANAFNDIFDGINQDGDIS